MPLFDYRFRVPASREAVLDFHASPEVLRRLTPPPMIVRIHRFGEMKEGMIAEFTLWLGPYPIRWRARHENVGPDGFTDVQLSGPASKWKHRHQFVAISRAETEIREHIEYEHKPGLAGIVSRLLFNRPSLRMLFVYRSWVTRRALAA